MFRMHLSHEDVRVENRTRRLHRATITTLDGMVVDQTGLYDDEDEAVKDGVTLIKLHQEKATERYSGGLDSIGYVRYADLERLREEGGSIGLYKNCDGQAVIPVYVKIGDYFHTLPVRTPYTTLPVKNQGFPDGDEDGN
jgi:hypothetical protein